MEAPIWYVAIVRETFDGLQTPHGAGTSGCKLLVLDIDGTLLTSSAEVSPNTLRALRRAADWGIVVTLATGRRLTTVRALIDQLGITCPVILQSGAQIYDPIRDAVLYSNAMPHGEVARGVRIALEEDLQPIIYENSANEQRLFIGPAERDSRGLQRYVENRPGLVRRMTYDALAEVTGALEIAIIDDLPSVKRAESRMVLSECRNLMSYSAALDSYFLEVFHWSCSKGEALRHLARHLNIPLGAIVAVGDNHNDREILQVAGLGVAMANAEPEILALAGHVTGSNDEDGIATLIHDFLGVAP